jgi:predicted nucleotidyltransferase
MVVAERGEDIAERRRIASEGARSALEKLRALGVEARVFGSLASGGFSRFSDIDFLVTRCPHDLKYAIEGVVEDCLEGFHFDVVYLDELPAHKQKGFLKEAVDASQLG